MCWTFFLYLLCSFCKNKNYGWNSEFGGLTFQNFGNLNLDYFIKYVV